MQHGNECSMEMQRPPAVVVARVKVTVAMLIVIGADIRIVRSMEMQRRSGSSKSKGNSSNAHRSNECSMEMQRRSGGSKSAGNSGNIHSNMSRYRNSKSNNNNRNVNCDHDNASKNNERGGCGGGCAPPQ